MRNLHLDLRSNYVDIEGIIKENKEASQIFIKNKWPTIKPIAFALYLKFKERVKINRILRHLTEGNRSEFEVFIVRKSIKIRNFKVL